MRAYLTIGLHMHLMSLTSTLFKTPPSMSDAIKVLDQTEEVF